jgi:hypothetical protein
MDSPYSPLFSNTTDRVVVWMAVLLAIAVAGFLGTRRAGPHAQNCYASVSTVFLVLCLAVLFIFLTGAAGAWLEITSFFWVFWELMFLMSAVAVFQVFPVLSAILVLWGVLGKVWHSYSSRSLATSVSAAAVVGIDCALYFLVQRLMK